MKFWFIGTSIIAQFHLSKGTVNSWVQINIGWGFAITVSATSVSRLSGGHLNPAMSTLFFSMGALDILSFLIYIISQHIGAFCGAAATYAIYRDAINDYDGGFRAVKGPNGTAQIFSTYPQSYMTHFGSYLDQTAGTGLLAFCVLSIIDPRNKIPPAAHPLLFGISLLVIGCGFGLNCGYPLNPARDFGPRIFTYFIYGNEVFTHPWSYWFLVPIIAPIIGALIGGWFYILLLGSHIPDEVSDNKKGCKQRSNNMTSIFTHFFSFDNSQKRLQQFHKQLEKLSQQKESHNHDNDNSFVEYQFQRCCSVLRKEMDDYKRKIEGTKNMDEQHQKENTLKELETLTNQLSSLMTPGKITTANDSTKMFASEFLKNEEIEEAEEKNNVQEEYTVEASSNDSSSDLTHTSDHSTDEEQCKTQDINLREKLEDTATTNAENNQFIALANFEGQEEKDLTLKKNELIRIIARREDGWWLAENQNGKRGYVPKTFLKIYKESIESKEIRKQFDKPSPMPRQTAVTKTKQMSNLRIIKNDDITEESKISDENEQQNETNVAIVKEITTPAEISNIVHESSTQSITVPDIFESSNSCTNHLTYECYLAPRLSKSNYAFHDIYWNYEDDRLRKRRVRVSKMIKIIRLDKIQLNSIDVHCRLVRAYLFDRKTTDEEYQIVSNVYTIKAQQRIREPRVWIFSTTNDIQKISLNYPSFILRSNYDQKNVTLCLEAAIVFTDHEGEMSEQSLGCVMIPIINESGHCCMQNKNYTVKMFSRNSSNIKEEIPGNRQIQITFRVSDISNNIVHQVDSLPDIFICNALFLPMFFYYRRLLGEFLTKNFINCNNAALNAEPFLATFPAIADQPDIMEMLLQLWKVEIKKTANKKLSEVEEAMQFRSFFLTTGFILHQTVAMPKFSWTNARCFADRQAILNHFREQYLHNFDAIKYLSRQRCHPINIYNYAVDIIGPHAVI
ncbi:Nephrocystin-1-like protein [Dirofilaria immitis]